MSVVDRQEWDVVVVGAGGAGLRAAIEARERGARTAVICKSLFGKAHTVMAEGGIAAAMRSNGTGGRPGERRAELAPARAGPAAATERPTSSVSTTTATPYPI